MRVDVREEDAPKRKPQQYTVFVDQPVAFADVDIDIRIGLEKARQARQDEMAGKRAVDIDP